MIDSLNKLQPQFLEAEESVLGSILSVPNAFDDISHLFTTDLFYVPKHQIIAQAILNLKHSNRPIDIITVSKEVKEKNVSAYDVSLIGSKYTHSDSTLYLTQILFQKYILRTLIKESTLIINKAYQNEDSIELLEHADNTIKSLFDMMKTSRIKDIDAVFEETIESMKTSSSNNGLVGISTGLNDLDSIINGLQGTFVYIVAARPGMGKSALMKSITKNCFDNKTPCAVFSLEMSAIQMMKGLFSDLADIHNQIIETGKLSNDEWSKILKYKGKFNNLLFIDDTPSITIQYLETNVKRLVKERGVKVVMIDYMQLMTLNKTDRFGRNREQEVSYLSSNIKRIAKKYNVAIVILSHLSRSVEDRKPPRPILSDLRESGSIEQDAEVVIFLYRPAYYKIFSDGQGNDLSNVAELIVAKNRFGPTKSAYVTFIKEKTKFENTQVLEAPTIYTNGNFKEDLDLPF